MNALLNFIASGPGRNHYLSAEQREHDALMFELTHVASGREAANDQWIGANDRAHESSKTMLSLFGV